MEEHGPLWARKSIFTAVWKRKQGQAKGNDDNDFHYIGGLFYRRNKAFVTSCKNYFAYKIFKKRRCRRIDSNSLFSP